MTDSSEQYRKMVDDPRIQEEAGKDPRLCKSVKQDDGLSWSPAIFYLPSQSWWQERLKDCRWDLGHYLTSKQYEYQLEVGDKVFRCSTPEQIYCRAFMWVRFGEKWDGKGWVK